MKYLNLEYLYNNLYHGITLAAQAVHNFNIDNTINELQEKLLEKENNITTIDNSSDYNPVQAGHNFNIDNITQRLFSINKINDDSSVSTVFIQDTSSDPNVITYEVTHYPTSTLVQNIRKIPYYLTEEIARFVQHSGSPYYEQVTEIEKHFITHYNLNSYQDLKNLTSQHYYFNYFNYDIGNYDIGHTIVAFCKEYFPASLVTYLTKVDKSLKESLEQLTNSYSWENFDEWLNRGTTGEYTPSKEDSISTTTTNTHKDNVELDFNNTESTDFSFFGIVAWIKHKFWPENEKNYSQTINTKDEIYNSYEIDFDDENDSCVIDLTGVV